MFLKITFVGLQTSLERWKARLRGYLAVKIHTAISENQI
jgi:hypothetical protein